MDKLNKLKRLAKLQENTPLATAQEFDRTDEEINSLKETDNKLAESITVLNETKVNKDELFGITEQLTSKIEQTKTIKGDKGDSIKGDTGATGKAGYTPIKGKDYFDGEDGYTPIKGKDYFDGENGKDAVVDYKKISQETTAKLESELPQFGEQFRDGLETLSGDERLDRDYIRGLDNYDELVKLSKEPRVINKTYTGATTDEKVKYDINDPTAGYLDDKITGYGFLTAETDPLSLHLDQTTPQTFTGGAVTGTGLLQVVGGVLGKNVMLTVSDTAPANPQMGDLWVDIS